MIVGLKSEIQSLDLPIMKQECSVFDRQFVERNCTDCYNVCTLARSDYRFNILWTGLCDVFSGTGGCFLCDHLAENLRQLSVSRGFCLQAASGSVLCCPLLPHTSLCADNRRFVHPCCCQIATQESSLYRWNPYSLLSVYIFTFYILQVCTLYFGYIIQKHISIQINMP